MANFQPDVAIQFFTRALESDSKNTDLMDTLADALLQVGDPEKAFPMLQRSIALAPDSSPYKYLYLAQLQDGRDSLNSVEKAILLLARDYAAAQAEEQEAAKPSATAMDTEADGGTAGSDGDIISAATLQKQLAKAYCTIAELFLTDLCEEDGAEQSCEQALTLAAAVDKDSLDVQQTFASLRISQCRPADAGVILGGVAARVCAALEMAQQQSILGNVPSGASASAHVFGGAVAGAALDECPDPQFCISTAKLLVECACGSPALAEQAMDLCQMLLEEDDENIELWYIMGMAALGASPPDTEAAIYHLEKAKEMILQLQENHGDDEGSKSMLVLIEQRLGEANAAAAEGEIHAEAEDDEEVEA